MRERDFTFRLRLNDDERAALDETAKRLQRTRSDVLRLAIRALAEEARRASEHPQAAAS